MATAETQAKEITDQELDVLLKLPDSEDVITSQTNTQTKSVLTDTNKQTEALLDETLSLEQKEAILNQDEEKKKAAKAIADAATKAANEIEAAKILANLDLELTNEEEEDPDKVASNNTTGKGRPKVD